MKRPESPDPWDGVKKAIKFGPRAPQKDFLWTKWTAHAKTNEDCLYLNVFSPTWAPPDDQVSIRLVYVSFTAKTITQFV